MSTLFTITGAIVWAFTAAVAALILLNLPVVRRPLNTRGAMPYSMYFGTRLKGFLKAAIAKTRLMKFPPEIIAAHRAISLADTKILRDVMAEMDELPTIVKGKQAVGLKSVFELSSRKVHRVKSPYTH